MSANNYDWAQALGSSPGSQLAALQARQYESETTERMMTKFDEAVMTMTAGITDPTELQAAQMRAETLLADKQALARSHATMTAPEIRAAGEGVPRQGARVSCFGFRSQTRQPKEE